MLCGPDCWSSDEEGLSDDNDYYEFKQRMKKKQRESKYHEVDSAVEEKKKQLQSVFAAISYGNEETVTHEFEKGLDVDADLDSGWTPLLLAATFGNDKIISDLIKRGADVKQSRDGSTALMLACNVASDQSDKVLACVKLLLDNGAEVNAIDHKRRTALMFAAYNGHIETVKLLLPLVDKKAEDNQRWTALFWAVDGNKVEIVDLLLKEGFDCDKTDIRGNSVVDIAHSNGFTDVLELLPKDTFNDEFYLHLNNNHFHFEDTFAHLQKHEKPQFFSDICKILYGTKSESVMPLLYNKNVSLLEFLSISDTKLKDLGIELPYQRNRIMGGLFRFHKHPYQPKSVPFIRKNELCTNLDVSSTVLSCIKQLIVMEASLKFIMENYEDGSDSLQQQEMQGLILKNRQQIKRLKVVVNQFVKEAKRWDSLLKPADRITRKRWNIPWSNLCLSIGIFTLVILIKLK